MQDEEFQMYYQMSVKRDQEIDQGLVRVYQSLQRVKQNAQEFSTELETQNRYLDRINEKVWQQHYKKKTHTTQKPGCTHGERDGRAEHTPQEDPEGGGQGEVLLLHDLSYPHPRCPWCRCLADRPPQELNSEKKQRETSRTDTNTAFIYPLLRSSSCGHYLDQLFPLSFA